MELWQDLQRAEGRICSGWKYCKLFLPTPSDNRRSCANRRQQRKPGQYTSVDPFTGRATDRPLRQTNEYIHPSVRTRFRLEGPGIQDRGLYEARALTDSYKLVVDYGTNNQRAGDAEVYWKIKWRDTHAVKVLPEAPLWRLERELARRDPATYDYVKRSPATSSTKPKRRTGRPMSADMSTSKVASPTSRKARRDTFSPRSTFPIDDRAPPPKRSNTKVERARSRSRARSVEFASDRETDIRESMPHRREKDKAWWEGRR